MITNLDDDLISGIVAKFGANVTRINLSSNGLRGLGNIEKISPCLEKLNLACNDLVDVRPLQNLSTLTELDLSENSLSDISALAALTRLERLDLSGNSIASLQALEPLQHITSLRTLSLQGNPACRALGYPHNVLALIPTLEVMDGCAHSPLQPLARNKPQTSSYSSPSPDVSSMTEAAGALSLRLAAMERAFELQEQALMGSAVEAARTTAISLDDADMDGAPNVESFPYLKLLQLWRRQALDSATQLTSCRAKLQAALTQLKEGRFKAGQADRAQQLTLLSYKEKGKAAQEQTAFLEARVADLETQRQQQLRYRALVDRERQDAHLKLSALRSFLESARAQAEEQAVQAMLQVSQAARTLKANEARVAACAERVQVAAALVAQREVVLRNSQAALEAGERLRSRPGADSTATDDCDDEMKEGEGDREGEEGEGPGLLSDLLIRPEVEALLRAIFRRLDVGESGHVPRATLLEFLGVGGQHEENQGTSVGRSLAEALGPAAWARLGAGLQQQDGQDQQLSTTTVTWGELLLCLLPRSRPERLAPLTVGELEALRGAGLWGDVEWAMVPLALPKEDRTLGSVEASHASSGDPELRRLAAERRHLLSKLQSMGRTLERRVEATKAHFVSALRRAKLVEARLQAQTTELKSSLEAAERRLKDATETHATIHRNATERITLLEEQLSEARALLDSRRDDETRSLENKQREEQARFSRLETEHALLQREMGKRDVRAKGLARDAMQLQAQVALAAEERSRLEAELAREREDHANLLRDEREAFAAEKETLLKRVAELESAARASPSAADSDETGAVASAGGDGGRDEFESVRRQMQLLRSLPTEGAPSASSTSASAITNHTAAGGPGQEHLRRAAAAGTGQSDVYAAHLTKLLRLAEEAISKS